MAEAAAVAAAEDLWAVSLLAAFPNCVVAAAALLPPAHLPELLPVRRVWIPLTASSTHSHGPDSSFFVVLSEGRPTDGRNAPDGWNATYGRNAAAAWSASRGAASGWRIPPASPCRPAAWRRSSVGRLPRATACRSSSRRLPSSPAWRSSSARRRTLSPPRPTTGSLLRT